MTRIGDPARVARAASRKPIAVSLISSLWSLIFGIAVPSCAAGPPEEWPTFKHDLKRTGYTQSQAPDVANVIWEKSIPGAGKCWSSPSIADGRLYIGNNNGNVYCVDATTGKQIWTFFTRVSQPVFSTATIANGMVFIAGYEMIYALPCHDPNNDGVISGDEVIWSFRFGKSTGGVNNVVTGSPAVTKGRLFLGAVDQVFYCFDAAQGGEPLWRTFTPYRGQHAFACSPAVADGKIFAATGNQSGSGRLYCFGEADGRILWEFDIDDITFSSPVIDGKRVFIANSGDWIGGNSVYRLYCLDVAGYLDRVDDGIADSHQGRSDLIWAYDTKDYVYGTPSIHGGRLYFGSCSGLFTCLDAEDGKVVWVFKTSPKYRTQPRGIFSSPTIADGKVFFCTIEGKLIALPEVDPDGDGTISSDEVIWSYPIGGDGVCSPVVADGFVYVGNHQGRLFCFGSRGGDRWRD